METITRLNCEEGRIFEHITLKNKSNKYPVQCRRNGKTKTWKTKPNEFKIPVKCGLYQYFYIDQDNCDQWLISD